MHCRPFLRQWFTSTICLLTTAPARTHLNTQGAPLCPVVPLCAPLCPLVPPCAPLWWEVDNWVEHLVKEQVDNWVQKSSEKQWKNTGGKRLGNKVDSWVKYK